MATYTRTCGPRQLSPNPRFHDLWPLLAIFFLLLTGACVEDQVHDLGTHSAALSGSQVCDPGDRAYCNWMGTCDDTGTTCECDDPEHRKASEQCSTWHHVTTEIPAGGVCQPGDRDYCNWMGVCAQDGSGCECSDPDHFWSSEQCAIWHPSGEDVNDGGSVTSDIGLGQADGDAGPNLLDQSSADLGPTFDGSNCGYGVWDDDIQACSCYSTWFQDDTTGMCTVSNEDKCGPNGQYDAALDTCDCYDSWHLDDDDMCTLSDNDLCGSNGAYDAEEETCVCYGDWCVGADGKCDGLESEGTCADACGVVNGDGTSCADACGVPNGDNSTCAADLCDASAAPANGDVGDCTSNLASGSTCQPTCDPGYTVSGVSSCLTGTLTAATCAEDGWVLGPPGASCTATCTGTTPPTVCNIDRINAVDSQQNFTTTAAAAGFDASACTFWLGYPNEFVPATSGTDCYWQTGSAATCDEIPWDGTSRRLCFCEPGSE